MNKMEILEQLVALERSEKQKTFRDQDRKRMSELKNSIARARSEIDCIVLRLNPHFPTLGVRQLVERMGELDAIVHDKAQNSEPVSNDPL